MSRYSKIFGLAAAAAMMIAPAYAQNANPFTDFLHQLHHKHHKSSGSADRPSAGSVITWGAQTNDPSWNQALGVTGSRMGCSGAPENCAAAADQAAKAAHVERVYIAYLLKPDTAVDYASQFSKLSLSHPAIAEIGFDDFRSQYIKLRAPDPNTVLRQVIAATKSANPHLALGITLYLDDLNSAQIRNLPEDVRSQIDNIHLYPKYRANGPRFANYVQLAKSEFPNAAIIGGVYAMDRVDYVSCQAGGRPPCSEDKEFALFQKTLRVEKNLWTQGQIAALEFYPGDFGKESDISSFNSAAQCAPNRRDKCVANTAKMRTFARDLLRGQQH